MGIANSLNTGALIALGGNLTTAGTVTFSGAHPFTGTLTGTTSVTFPVSGTLLTSSTAATSITGTANQIAASPSTGAVTISLPAAVVMPGTLTLNADPIANLEAATKQYVDAIAGGFELKNACFSAATTNLTATYNNGATGIGATLTNSGTQAIFATDGTTPAINSRILVQFQTSMLQNGIYTLTAVGSAFTNWVLTRSTDYDTSAQIVPGSLVPVTNGTLYASTSWLQTATVTTVGTDPISFIQFTFANPVTNVAGTANRITSTGGQMPVIDISASYVGQSSITTVGALSSGSLASGFTVISPALGGTGVNNSTHTLTLGGNTAFTGAFTFAGALTANTSVTFPVSGNLLSDSAGTTGTGAFVLQTSPTLITPTLGVASATSVALGVTGSIATLSNTTLAFSITTGAHTTTLTKDNFVIASSTNTNTLDETQMALTSTAAGSISVKNVAGSTFGVTVQGTTSGTNTKLTDAHLLVESTSSNTTITATTTTTPTLAATTANIGTANITTLSIASIAIAPVTINSSGITVSDATGTTTITPITNTIAFASGHVGDFIVQDSSGDVFLDCGAGSSHGYVNAYNSDHTTGTFITGNSALLNGTAPVITLDNGTTSNTVAYNGVTVATGTSTSALGADHLRLQSSASFTDIVDDAVVVSNGTTSFLLSSDGVNKVYFTDPTLIGGFGATVTIAGGSVFKTVGAFTTTLTSTATTNVTLPTSGTLITTAVTTLPSLTSAASLATVGTITTGTWNATTIAMIHGGTGTALTGNSNGIVYCDTTTTMNTTATGSVGNILRAGTSGLPAWTSATYPTTTTGNQLLYSSGTNTIAGLATQNSAMLVTNNSGTPVWSGTLTNGQMIIGSTSGTPSVGIITSSTGIVTNPGAGSMTIDLPSAIPGANMILNGDFQIWQRSTGGTGTATITTNSFIYGPDRWQIGVGANSTTVVFSQQSSGLSGSYALRMQRSSGNTGVGNVVAATSLTRDMCIGMANHAVTLSFTAVCGADFSSAGKVLTFFAPCGTNTTDVSFITGTYTGSLSPVISGSQAITTTATRYTVTGSPVSGLATLMGIEFFWTPAGTAATNDWVQITDVSLSISTVATNFQRLSFAYELALCQYFYNKSFDYTIAPAAATGSLLGTTQFQAVTAGATNGVSTTTFPVKMRVDPTVTIYNPRTTGNQADNGTMSQPCTSTSAATIGQGAFSINTTLYSGTAVGNNINYHYTADAEL